jgi:lipid-A-disaccharide synthase
MARSRLLLAASGTVTTEAAILGTPMVAFYKVKPSTWLLFRRFVDVPHFTMVNLVAGWAATPEERLVLELIQNEMTAERLSAEAMRLLMDDKAREEMIVGLAGVRNSLATGQDPIERAAELVMEVLETTALKTNALKDAHAH